ncbi:hypothetical protein TCAL_08876 [Tigriopus californicus]|uniref:Uncharacterized protein n=1 Tax=Tigriopus californicus TaxID=6832 RepID=A0A553N7N0_TIGCA|nr:hypothetical protein TCAL_08876 [Tigriopus californicus]
MWLVFSWLDADQRGHDRELPDVPKDEAARLPLVGPVARSSRGSAWGLDFYVALSKFVNVLNGEKSLVHGPAARLFDKRRRWCLSLLVDPFTFPGFDRVGFQDSFPTRTMCPLRHSSACTMTIRRSLPTPTPTTPTAALAAASKAVSARVFGCGCARLARDSGSGVAPRSPVMTEGSVASFAPEKDYRVPPQFVEEQTLQQPSKQKTPRDYSRDFSSDLAAVGFSEPGSCAFAPLNNQGQAVSPRVPVKIFQSAQPRVCVY